MKSAPSRLISSEQFMMAAAKKLVFSKTSRQKRDRHFLQSALGPLLYTSQTCESAPWQATPKKLRQSHLPNLIMSRDLY